MKLQQNKVEGQVNQWNRSIPFPKDSDYAIRCIGEELVVANKTNNTYLKLEWEIVNCPAKQVGENTYAFDGVTCNEIQMLGIRDDDGNWDMDKTQNCINYLIEKMKKCGCDVPEDGVDFENPQLPIFLGKVVWASLYGEKYEQRKEPTAEQKAQRKPGDIMKDPVTGKDLVAYNIKVGQVFGPYTQEVRPF